MWSNGAVEPRVAYLGWHRKGNLGDDAIYDAVKFRLPGAVFADLPRMPHELAAAFATGSVRSLRRSALVMGGGTVIGRRYWRLALRGGSKLTRRDAAYAIGVGVEDPVFSGRRSGSGRGELQRWAAILPRLRMLSVRGPRSAELLADIGVDARVAGDPALVLPRPAVAAEDGLIGLNLGFGDDLWGHDPAAVADAVAAAVGALAPQGYRFLGILMNAADEKLTRSALGGVPAEIVLPADPAGAARELARCSVAIVSRLHAGILAALSDTPVVALEYQPKCRDFALSIDDEGSLIRTDRVSGTAVLDKVHGALADSAGIRARKGAAVAALRRPLEAEYAVLAGDLGLRAPASGS